MKLKKQFLTLLICFCTLFLVNGINAEAASIKLSASSALVGVGKTKTLTATVTGSSKTVKWSSSDKAVATVTSKGVVKGIKAGRCTITAKANGKTATCSVKISKLPSKAILQAYAKKVKSYDSNYKFGLIYLDYNLIPELVIVSSIDTHVEFGHVFTYKDGKVKEIKGIGSDFAKVFFCPKKSVVINKAFINGYGQFITYEKLNSSYKTSVLKAFENGLDIATMKTAYKIDGKKVSSSTYTSKLKDYEKKYPAKTVDFHNTFANTKANLDKLVDNYKSVVVKF